MENNMKRMSLSAKERLNLLIELTDDEFDALLGHIPMTQELFEGVLRGCAGLDDMKAFTQLTEQYPEYIARLREKIFITGESTPFLLDKEKGNR